MKNKKIIKLINNERINPNISSEPACSWGATDKCSSIDRAECTLFATDVCNKDYSGCSYKAHDECGIDYAR